MAKKNSAFISVLIFFISIAFLVFSIMLFKKAETETLLRKQAESSLNETQDKLEETVSEKDKIQSELEEYKVVRKQVEEERDMALEKAAKLADELRKEKIARQELQKKLEEKQKAALLLMKQLQEERQQREKLNTQVIKLSKQGGGQQQDLLEKLKKLQQEKKDLEDRLTQYKIPTDGISIKPIEIVTEQRFDGKVLNVNSEFNFVILDIGKVDGITPGVELIVHRGRRLIGKVRVERIYEKMCSANIIPKFSRGTINVDDSATKF